MFFILLMPKFQRPVCAGLLCVLKSLVMLLSLKGNRISLLPPLVIRTEPGLRKCFNMSKSVTQNLRLMRELVLKRGAPSWAVYVGNRRVAKCSSFELADSTARVLSSRHIGIEFRVEERKFLDGIFCISRVRYWRFVPVGFFA